MTKSGNSGERYNLTKSTASELMMETRTISSFSQVARGMPLSCARNRCSDNEAQCAGLVRSAN